MISIVIPTYNEADNIKMMVPMIQKIFMEEDIEGEIIIVDDHSPDGTASIASKLSNKYPFKDHVRKGKRGLSKAVIKGFELAKGDIIVVMDSVVNKNIHRQRCRVLGKKRNNTFRSDQWLYGDKKGLY